jgi:hypothetical protein
VLFDLFLHLDFGDMALAIMEFCFQPSQGLGYFAGAMGLTSFLLASIISSLADGESTCAHGSPDVSHAASPPLQSQRDYVCLLPSMYSFCGIVDGSGSPKR